MHLSGRSFISVCISYGYAHAKPTHCMYTLAAAHMHTCMHVSTMHVYSTLHIHTPSIIHCGTNHILHKPRAVEVGRLDELETVHHSLGLQPLQLGMQTDEDSSATDSITVDVNCNGQLL